MTIEGLIDLTGLAEFKAKVYDWVRRFRQHTEIAYVGIGLTDDNFTMNPYEVSQITETVIEVETEGHFLYILYPKTALIEVTMSGLGIPMEQVGDTTILGKDYWIYRSANNYIGILEIGLILKL